MSGASRFVCALATSLLVSLAARAAGTDSVYLSLPSDYLVYGAVSNVLSTSVSGGRWVFIESDGRYYPSGGDFADVYITVDGQKVSNDSPTDWRNSDTPVQRSYNVAAAVYLSAGQHQIAITAVSLDYAIELGAGSNLSVMTSPATNVVQASVPSSGSPVIQKNVAGIEEGTPIPVTSVATASVNSDGTPIVAVASGNVSYAGTPPNGYGDAMWNLSLDGVGEHNALASWSDNDVWTGAELESPEYVHGLFAAAVGTHVVSLDASAQPYIDGSPNGVQYRVGAGTGLILLNGGMTVVGSAPRDSEVNTRFPYVCVGTNQAWPGCPTIGTTVILDQATITVPTGHNGVVFMMAKTRVQGDSSDLGGNASLSLVIDGQGVGSHGVQQLQTPNSVSTRTICASYLAAGAHALTPGRHVVQLIAQVSGSFIHLSMTKDLPLIWFD